ncbi:MAG: HD domain-containing protein [Treponema sp.]|nr:HD domain-containing protein [Treponema sp.]
MKIYYILLFAISLLYVGIYALLWHKRFSVFFTLIFAFIPIANLGFLFTNTASTLEGAVIGIKLSYIGACYLILFIVYSILDLCKVNTKKWIHLLLLLISTLVFMPTLFIGHSQLFYKSIRAEFINGQIYLTKNYGICHTIFNIQIMLYLLMSIVITLYTIKKKNDASRVILHILLWSEFITIFMFFGAKLLHLSFDLVPLAYVIAETCFLLVIRRIALYDIEGTVIDTIALNGETGFISFDKRFNYLGCNKLSESIFPELKKIKIDTKATKNQFINDELILKIQDFIKDNSKDHFFKEAGEKIYQIDIRYLYGGNTKRGYMLYIQDDTQDQKYITLLDNFNGKLKEEVEEKTHHIIEMHNQLIMGMATMVESRDNSTGGHIKRTSEGVRILIKEIMKDNELHLSKEFCKNLIKAAPMHDLGKIAVDDAILRKPGRFTDEEFEKMKSHAAEGAKIVHEILKSSDDVNFNIIAENVAHYHHERWDGSGYPCGLKGEEIPLEARIMAIADVYDALVSKRVYKESMTFEEADKIIMEGMGKHFDRQLEKYYIAARPNLEKYYSKINQ